MYNNNKTKQTKKLKNHKNYSQVQHDNFMECDEDDDHLKTRQKHACELKINFFQNDFHYDYHTMMWMRINNNDQNKS